LVKLILLQDENAGRDGNQAKKIVSFGIMPLAEATVGMVVAQASCLCVSEIIHASQTNTQARCLCHYRPALRRAPFHNKLPSKT
jgi:hypothetical protein